LVQSSCFASLAFVQAEAIGTIRTMMTAIVVMSSAQELPTQRKSAGEAQMK
jgi:hypothetical protein